MSQPGWYRDPAGQPGQYRYWDGAQWGQETTDSPSAAAPASPQRPDQGRLLAVVAVVLTLVLVVWFVVRGLGGTSAGAPEDTNSSTPTISGWDETSTPTPTDPEGSAVACPGDGSTTQNPGVRNGRYFGGGLSYPEVPGWEGRSGWGVDWLQDRDGQRQSVAEDWVALTVVGQVDTARFTTPQNAAHQVINCLATSYYYQRFVSRTDVVNTAVTVDGRPAWRISAEVRVEGYSVEGDVVTVIALDAGREGKIALFVSEAPLGDTGRQQLVEDAIKGLEVVG